MYKAIEKIGHMKTSLLEDGPEFKFWAVENDRGELYANITSASVEGQPYTAEEFAKVLAFALTNDLPTFVYGGMTLEQFESASALYRAMCE